MCPNSTGTLLSGPCSVHPLPIGAEKSVSVLMPSYSSGHLQLSLASECLVQPQYVTLKYRYFFREPCFCKILGMASHSVVA